MTSILWIVAGRWCVARATYPLKDAAAFQCHLAYEHGLSRTRPVNPASSAALDSQDKKMPVDKEVLSVRPSRKHKSSTVQ